MKNIAIILATLFSVNIAHANDGVEIDPQVAEDIAQYCRLAGVTFYDIDNNLDLDEPVDPEASEEACVRALNKLDQDFLQERLNESDWEWYQEKRQEILESDFVDEPNSHIGKVDLGTDIDPKDFPDFE